MSLSVKVAATVGITSGAVVAMVEFALQAAAVQPAGLTGNPIVDGLIGGAGVSLLTIGIYKNKVDQLKEDVREIKQDVRELRQHLMGDK